MKLIPAKKFIICKDPEMEKTEDGIHLPDPESDKQKPETGIVLEIGAGVLPLSVKKGDKIIYRKYMANKISILGSGYNFIEFKDVIGVVK